jgi:predicted PolB exonuclease-like 3'-5' exonuclease
MNGIVIVWDLETVPDLRGFAAANGLVGKTDEAVREAIGDKFPKHIYHSIVCIGALVAHADGDHWAVDALGAPHVGERTEKQLISAFVGKIADVNPQLVTFNGSSFDLPVLRYRAMIHAVAAPGLAARSYFSRYTEDALDLCDALASFSPAARATLNEISRIMGLPGKPDGIDGGHDKYFIRAFCHMDRTFKDFLLPRFIETKEGGAPGAHPSADGPWNEFIAVELVPHPQLSKPQRRVVALDYAMDGESIKISVRLALLYYFLKRLNLEGDAERRPLREQHVVIKNKIEVRAALKRAQEQEQTPLFAQSEAALRALLPQP